MLEGRDRHLGTERLEQGAIGRPIDCRPAAGVIPAATAVPNASQS